MTQAEQIKQHLSAGKSITPIEALMVYGIYRLSAAILLLRQSGLKIVTSMKADEKGKRYAQYKLA